MRDIINTFKALSDPVRLRIIKMLEVRNICVCEFTKALNVGQPTVSHHLKILRNAGLVCSIKEGIWVYYKLCSGKYNKYTPCVLKFMSECINNEQEFDNDKREIENKILDCKTIRTHNKLSRSHK